MRLLEGVVSAQVISVLIGLLIFSVGSVIISFVRNPKKISLQEKLINPRGQERVEILKERTYSDTRYGRFYKAYIGPYVARYPNFFERLSGLLGVNIDVLDKKIREAKLEKAFTAEEVVSMKLLGTIGMVVLLLLAISLNFNMLLVVAAVMSYMLGSIIPQRKIDQKIAERRETIENTLPDFLDLVKSVTESGLSIQEALNKVTAKMKGPLAEEFRAVMVETKANGGQWKLAMENMAFRNDIESLSDVVSDILIAYEKGTPISETLKKEADMMRQLKNTRIQEKARGLSVKLIVPMAIFSFIPLLVLLMGPMLIQLSRNLA